MKLPAGIEKWGSVVLGVLSLLLVANLVGQYRGMQPGNSRANPAPASASPQRAGKDTSHVTDDLGKYDPTVHFDALKALDSRSLPDEDRNPFEFVGGEPAPSAAQTPVAPPRTLPPAAPPPPPPPPLKAVGYNELPGGKKEAMVTYNDDMVMVHEGDLIGTKYRVAKITPAMVVVEDGETHQTLELPFPP
jgi:hypothetical protein